MHLHGLPTSLDKWNNGESTAQWKLMKVTIIIIVLFLPVLLTWFTVPYLLTTLFSN